MYNNNYQNESETEHGQGQFQINPYNQGIVNLSPSNNEMMMQCMMMMMRCKKNNYAKLYSKNVSNF